MSRDWDKEMENLATTSKYFKPMAGKTYEIEFLDEGGEAYEQDYDDKTFKRRDFQIRVNGGGYKKEEKTWTLNMSGKNSLYGMIVTVFKHLKQSIGVTIHLKAEGEKLERKYFIKEYNDLQFQEETAETKKEVKK